MSGYNSSLPYSVYASDTTKPVSGGGGGGENLDETLVIGNNAGEKAIDMNVVQNIVNAHIVTANNVITDLVELSASVVKCKLDGANGNIDPCNDVIMLKEGNSVDLTSTGTLNYNLLSPDIPPYQPSSFSLSGFYTPSDVWASGTDYNMIALTQSQFTVFQEYPPLPNPQGLVSVLNGWFRNGLGGWYKIHWNFTPAIPVLVPEKFITFTMKLQVYSNDSPTPPPLKTYTYPYNTNPNSNILNFNGSTVIYLPSNNSCEMGFIGTTTNAVDYILINEVQFSGELISKGTP